MFGVQHMSIGVYWGMCLYLFIKVCSPQLYLLPLPDVYLVTSEDLLAPSLGNSSGNCSIKSAWRGGCCSPGTSLLQQRLTVKPLLTGPTQKRRSLCCLLLKCSLKPGFHHFSVLFLRYHWNIVRGSTLQSECRCLSLWQQRS